MIINYIAQELRRELGLRLPMHECVINQEQRYWGLNGIRKDKKRSVEVIEIRERSIEPILTPAVSITLDSDGVRGVVLTTDKDGDDDHLQLEWADPALIDTVVEYVAGKLT